MNRPTQIAIAGVVILVSLGGTYLLSRGESPLPAPAAHVHGTAQTANRAAPVMLTQAEALRIGVTYATASVAPLSRDIRSVGQVTYDETRLSTVAAKVDGWVESLHVDYTGEQIHRGEPMFSLYSPMLVTAQEELLLAKRLASDVAGGTPDAVRGAEGLVSSARQRLLFWDVPASEVRGIERAAEVRRAVTFVSPVGGFVVEKSVVVGQKIMAGEALYRVADLSTVWVLGEIFEQDLLGVRVGQSVVAELEAFPGERWEGHITYVYPTLDADTRTARVRVALPNPHQRLKPGMYATLLLRGEPTAGVLSVPRSAVLATGSRTLVFVKRDDGMLEPREVVVGLTTPERIEVRQGLVRGDVVVASATFLVDAESNVGSALGGMGEMPGMDLTAPVPARR